MIGEMETLESATYMNFVGTSWARSIMDWDSGFMRTFAVPRANLLRNCSASVYAMLIFLLHLYV
jgi:hypothetical protein